MKIERKVRVAEEENIKLRTMLNFMLNVQMNESEQCSTGRGFDDEESFTTEKF